MILFGKLQTIKANVSEKKQTMRNENKQKNDYSVLPYFIYFIHYIKNTVQDFFGKFIHVQPTKLKANNHQNNLHVTTRDY